MACNRNYRVSLKGCSPALSPKCKLSDSHIPHTSQLRYATRSSGLLSHQNREVLPGWSFISPPPCGEGLGVGVARCTIILHDEKWRDHPTPTLDPSPQGGGEMTFN